MQIQQSLFYISYNVCTRTVKHTVFHLDLKKSRMSFCFLDFWRLE